ncbi:MarR family winged helix-turn-helix transcriptional regulator [Clavibacter tessellarius]|uniref:ArsR family transcriptional regulator n=1 Tax=Clavibacter tessellarius TaxID=31965 RepID=A0A154V4N6_9MICO|nr:MarR family winged helix-turn-helix transcriptional regulator [Clavibacter michiganensis]KZC96209.1 ArsR family transcriptional regulator [Clavibacter michiganensis subsp. tessellarius]
MNPPSAGADRAPAADEREAAVSAVAAELAGLLMSIRSLRIEEAALFHPGLQPGAFAVARWLRTDGPASAGAVATGLLMDKSSVSRHLRVLREEGYVQDEPDPADRRSTILSLTPRAEERLEQVRASTRGRLQNRLHAWDTDDVERLAEALHRFNQSPRDRPAED